jgi:hypothetical protein
VRRTVTAGTSRSHASAAGAKTASSNRQPSTLAPYRSCQTGSIDTRVQSGAAATSASSTARSISPTNSRRLRERTGQAGRQPVPEPGQHGALETGVGQLQAKQVIHVDPGPHLARKQGAFPSRWWAGCDLTFRRTGRARCAGGGRARNQGRRTGARLSVRLAQA